MKKLYVILLCIATTVITILCFELFKKEYYIDTPKIIFSINKEDVKQLNNKKILNDIQTTIKNELESYFQRRFDETISKINFTITLFGIFMAVFIILLGIISFERLNKLLDQSNKTLKDALEMPNKLVQKYNRQRIDLLLKNLKNINPLIRSNAIRELCNNPEISNNEYDDIKDALYDEFEGQHSQTVLNIIYLGQVLIKTDKMKACNDIIYLINNWIGKYINIGSFNALYELVAASQNDLAIEILFNFTNDSRFEREHKNKIIKSLLSSNSLKDEYADKILVEYSEDIIYDLFNLYYDFPKMFKESLMVEAIKKRDDITEYITEQIFNNSLKKLVSDTNKINILNEILKNPKVRFQTKPYSISNFERCIENKEILKVHLRQIFINLEPELIRELKTWFKNTTNVSKEILEEMSS